MIEKIKQADFLFFSAFDHNSGDDCHGLYEMFRFFRDNLKNTSIFVNTLHSIFKNDVDVFDISKFGKNASLFDQITDSEYRDKSPYSWKNLAKSKYKIIAANALIKVLPKHKFFIIIDKKDIDFEVLDLVLKHFQSKLLIISGVNNTWTGYCSYPAEFQCERYKTEAGCDMSCPALREKTNPQTVRKNFDSARKFLKKNKDSVLLNVGNMFSFREASESFLFRDIKKVLIPLKNLKCEENFEKLFDLKKINRSKIVSNFKESINKETKLIMWSAFDIEMKRKGFHLLVCSLEIIKKSDPDTLKKICLVLCCKFVSEKYFKKLKELGVKFVFAGFLNRWEYSKYSSGCDFYCCTTISDAGPRTTYESAAMATPVISFDNCNSLDFVNSSNGALVKTYDVKKMSEEITRLIKIDNQQYKCMSRNIHDSYMKIMDTDTLVKKWEKFFDDN